MENPRKSWTHHRKFIDNALKTSLKNRWFFKSLQIIENQRNSVGETKKTLSEHRKIIENQEKIFGNHGKPWKTIETLLKIMEEPLGNHRKSLEVNENR